MRQWPKTRARFLRAKEVMPWGVTSNFRYWGDDRTIVVSRGEGPYIYDLDGNRYIDYRLGYGPVILGHGHPAVVERVSQAIRDGVIFAATTEWEIRAAERIIRMTGVDMVRFSNSGTEATMHALRIARAYTGREKVIKFEGQYHGHHDYLLFSTAMAQRQPMGSRRHPIPVVASSGIPRVIADLVITLPFNDFEAVERTVKAKWGDIAAIIVEPMLGNSAAIMPHPEFLPFLRRLCDEYGIVLIFDEVKTGFRIARGGAQEFFGVRADLVTYAKAMGNGFPISAIGGKREIMMTIEPGAVAHAGTYNGNVVGTAAADATLEILETTDALERAAQAGERLMKGISEILTEAGIPHAVSGHPNMFSFLLNFDGTPRDHRDTMSSDIELYAEIGLACYERGVMFEVDPREPWFTSAAHTPEVVDETLNRFADAVRAVLRKGKPVGPAEVTSVGK
jgi:glutamate-1-semialdehyde 2,1-aminomutase